MPPKCDVGYICGCIRLRCLDGYMAAKRFCVPFDRNGIDLSRLLYTAQALTCPSVNMLYQRTTIRSDLLAIGISKGHDFLHAACDSGCSNPGTNPGGSDQ